jgi:hypothetical protein
MEHGKVIRGKTLGAWKKYAEEEYSNTPAQVLKYIIVLEEELSKLHQPTVSVSDCIANDEAEHFMTIDCIGYCQKCGSMKQYEH